ncbi:DUF4843 domain-containing protein [Chitinophaga sp. sic0106]|uniref:DUF4843 domain-containing protein n=1 Tax=Chitinophaga sp. sic0106 TaxID=2854785 RepID=UPI001C491045|nr:DUF4843 domain-containing protein [Chitinophaga sp. sic0106]MBV7529648.1 DUF4843 domain-containing protein [Chitinophaga sp. sic0106]
MKNIICLCALALMITSGCKKAPYLTYSDIARVQMSDTTTQTATFVFESKSLVQDTVYIDINTIGGITPYDRPVKLVQVPEVTWTYKRDPATNLIIDSTATELPYKALPGVHYVDFNDKAVQAIMVVKANEATAKIPVILLRDASLAANTYRLRVQLVANDQFGLGEKAAREKTLTFSDHLERFKSWQTDNGLSPAYSWFNKYSVGKHQFMIDVLKQNIDEAWYQAANGNGSLRQFVIVLKEALAAYNSDPANIASGKAPVRENASPTSPAITFP